MFQSCLWSFSMIFSCTRIFIIFERLKLCRLQLDMLRGGMFRYAHPCVSHHVPRPCSKGNSKVILHK